MGAARRVGRDQAGRGGRPDRAQRVGQVDPAARVGGDSRVAEAEDAGTRKGRSFEERVHGAIERIAQSRGDCATHTGGEQAEGGGKKGDTLVEFDAAEGPARRPDRLRGQGQPPLEEPGLGRAQRGDGGARTPASASSSWPATSEFPAGRELLHEYEGNKLIVAVDREDPDGLVLETAYRLAAARLKLARDSNLQVDAGRRPRRGRGGDLDPQAGPGDPLER